jgi:hypothetical protein
MSNNDPLPSTSNIQICFIHHIGLTVPSVWVQRQREGLTLAVTAQASQLGGFFFGMLEVIRGSIRTSIKRYKAADTTPSLKILEKG